MCTALTNFGKHKHGFYHIAQHTHTVKLTVKTAPADFMSVITHCLLENLTLNLSIQT